MSESFFQLNCSFSESKSSSAAKLDVKNLSSVTLLQYTGPKRFSHLDYQITLDSHLKTSAN